MSLKRCILAETMRPTAIGFTSSSTSLLLYVYIDRADYWGRGAQNGPSTFTQFLSSDRAIGSGKVMFKCSHLGLNRKLSPLTREITEVVLNRGDHCLTTGPIRAGHRQNNTFVLNSVSVHQSRRLILLHYNLCTY